MKPGKDHPAWLHKAMAEGGVARPVKEMTRGELAQTVAEDANPSFGNPNALLGGAGVGALIKGAMARHPVGKALGVTLGTAATGLGAQGLVRDYNKMDKAYEAKDELKQRDKADQESGRYAKGGWIKNAIKKPGALRQALHAKKGEPIPAKKLAKAAHSDNPKLAKRARLAQTLKGLGK